MPKTCKVPTCSYPVFSKMLCINHWRCSEHNKPIKKQVTLKQTDKSPAKPFRAISPKRAEALKKYRRLRDKYFEEHPICEYPDCNSKNITLHHKLGRCGAFLTDKRHFCSLCLTHHRWVEENVLEAQRMGLSGKRLDKFK